MLKLPLFLLELYLYGFLQNKKGKKPFKLILHLVSDTMILVFVLSNYQRVGVPQEWCSLEANVNLLSSKYRK